MRNNILLIISIIFVLVSCTKKKQTNGHENHMDKVNLEFPKKIKKGDSVKLKLEHQLSFDSLNLEIDGLDLKSEEMRKRLFYYKDEYISENDLFNFAKDSSQKAQERIGIKKIKLKSRKSTFFYHKFNASGKTQFCGLLVDAVIAPDENDANNVQMKYSTVYLLRNVTVRD